MEELIRVIQELGELSWMDYVQLILTIITIIISAVALIFAIRIPRKIAEEQNRIALFEKRYNIFQFYEKCISFSNALKRAETLEEMQKSCDFSFEIK